MRNGRFLAFVRLFSILFDNATHAQNAVTKRRRLTRSLYLSVLAIAGLFPLGYFPLAGIRAANSGAAILPSAGMPLVNLKTPQNLQLTYTGPADAVAALQAGTATPTALAAADFDADGAMDVVAGYSTKNGGLLVVMRGNPDAYAPTDLTLYGKAAKGNVPPTFLSKATAFAVQESPDLLVTADFNRDGSKDVLVGTRDGALYLLAGDGHGNLLAPQAVPLPGHVTALAVMADGHVAVSVDGPNGPQLAMLAPGAEGLTAGAIYPLPARGDAMEWGSLGGGADLAVGAGANVVMFYNALATNPQTETVTVPFEVKGLALGDFIWDRDGRTEISVLADDGSIHILQHGTLNTTPLTAAELPARQAAIRGHHAKPTAPPNPTALGAWTIAKQLPYTGSAPSGPVSASAFSSPRVASASAQDLMVLDAGRSQLNILDTSGAAASPSAGISFTGTPVAALALPGKIDAGRDIVVLTSSQSAPMLVTTGSSLIFNVTNTADEDDAGACTALVLTGPGSDGVLSLREAVCEANNNHAAATINVPSGTYSLTSLETGELRQGVNNLGVAVSYNLTINGTGTAANTIIQQTDTSDRIFEEDYLLAGSNPVTIQNVTMSGGHCSNIASNDCGFGGGAIIAGGMPGDTLTLTNVVMSNNSTGGTAVGNAANNIGGAVAMEAPNITITNSTFSGNTAETGGLGGGVYFLGASTGGGGIDGSISITNSTFTNNVSGTGGGVYYVQVTAPQTATITGSTFTGNQASATGAPPAGQGGAVFGDAEGTSPTATISNNRFANDSAASSGSGLYMEGLSYNVTATHNWWGCNAGPGNSGCDSVFANVADGTIITTTPVLTLSFAISSLTTLPNTSVGLQANLVSGGTCTGYFNNECYVPDGTPVSFSPGSLGTLGTSSATFSIGAADATFVAGSTPGTDTFTATVDNQTVSATINIQDTVTVDTSPTGLSVIVDTVTYTAPQTFHWTVGSSHTLNTTSPQNVSGGTEQVWSSWSQGGTQSQTVSAPVANTTYTANFTTAYQLTTQASPSADGTVTPASGNYYAGGAIVPVTATANAGFAFTNWTSIGGTFDSTTTASTNFHMPSAPATVTGNFVALVQITITTSPANLLVSADGGAAVAAPLVESWQAGSVHTIATSSPQSGGAGVQYVWSNWNDSGALSHPITVPGTPTTYTATFNTQYQLTTQASPSADGSVSPASGSFFASGATIPVTASVTVVAIFSSSNAMPSM
jgi:hypothetical protein